MKSLLPCLMCLFLMISCTRDNNTVNTPQGLSAALTQYQWTILQFSEDGNDRLYLFGGYTFIFENGGNVTASKGGASAIGTWNVYTESGGGSKLFLDFGRVSPFDKLNEDWRALEVSAGQIRLEHVSGGGGGTDLLTFRAK